MKIRHGAQFILQFKSQAGQVLTAGSNLIIPCHLKPLGKVPYSETMRFWQGTVFLMQVPLRGSTLSTITNGASSSVTMLRWSSSCSSVSGHIRGHKQYFICRDLSFHFPTCTGINKRPRNHWWRHSNISQPHPERFKQRPLYIIERRIIFKPYAQNETTVSKSKKSNLFIYSPTYQTLREDLLCADIR